MKIIKLALMVFVTSSLLAKDIKKWNPLSLYLDERKVLIYVESNRKTISAIDREGNIIWTSEPTKNPLFGKYRLDDPVIVKIVELDSEVKKRLKDHSQQYDFQFEVYYNSSQFGAIDINHGYYTQLGQD